MEELSIEQKAKAYDEVRDKIALRFGANVAKEIFSQFEDSEDERMVRELIAYFRNNSVIETWSGLNVKKVIAWLEKQIEKGTNGNEREIPNSEQKPIMIQWQGNNLKEVIDFVGKDKNFEKWFKSFEEYERYVHEHNNIFKLFNEDGSHYEVPVGSWIVKTPDGYNVASKAKYKQNPTDKVETKFHEGDWVILTVGKLSTTLQIVKVDTNKKLYWFKDNTYLPIVDEECLHLWTIQGAKDGDVLVSKDGDEILIFRNLDTSTSFSSYYNIQRKGELGWSNECFIPATKEQRDTLMKAMADAGYTFDFEKKELKKIENGIEIPFGAKDSELQEVTYYIPKGFHAEIDDDKVVIKKGEKPAAWSEEDDYTIERLLCLLDNEQFNYSQLSSDFQEIEEIKNKLKSLKERYTWKPSKEQIIALRWVLNNVPYNKHKEEISGLLDQIKDL